MISKYTEKGNQIVRAHGIVHGFNGQTNRKGEFDVGGAFTYFVEDASKW